MSRNVKEFHGGRQQPAVVLLALVAENLDKATSIAAMTAAPVSAELAAQGYVTPSGRL
jgi:hypothetical protein